MRIYTEYDVLFSKDNIVKWCFRSDLPKGIETLSICIPKFPV